MKKYSRVSVRYFWRKSRTVVLLALGLFALFQVTVAATRSTQTYNNGRFGFGVTREGGAPSNYDVPMLNSGWYWDWAARGETAIPLHEYVQTVRLNPVKSGGVQIGYTAAITGSNLRNAIAAQPGGIWFIGNEPDCVNMDNMRSDWYARAYHDMYYLIKDADPTAIVGAGGIVQPTQQRFMYLDRVLETYEREYGEPLPTDLWVTHGYILCENCYPWNPDPKEPFAWGACWVPDWPSSTASKDIATFYSVYDHWDIELFKQRLIDMRQWMHDNGYQYHPLYITEYGILFYDGLVSNMGQEETIEFMHLGFDWMREARDPVLGYAPDDNRLVQRWAWFSLDHNDYYMGNPLFNQHTYNPTAIGIAYGDYTAQLSPFTHIIFDLDVNILADVGSTPVTATVALTMSNAGNVAATEGITWTLYDKQALDVPLAQIAIPPLACCGDYEDKTALWPNLSRSSYVLCPGDAATITGIAGDCQSFGVDLQIQNVFKSVIKVPPGELVTVTLTADVTNLGNIGTGEAVTVLFYIPGTSIIPIQSFTIDPLNADETRQPLTAAWTNLSAGLHSYCVKVMTSQAASEPACGFVWINPPHQSYLPLITTEP